MSDRAEGYVTELVYTPGYHEGIDPACVIRRLTEAGFKVPKIERACELGFGRGLNIAIHSVAGTVGWWGNDLLDSHVEGVRALTQGLTDKLHVYAETFVEFCARDDLPQFEFIALHGVWSWVSADNRRRICEFITRRLAPGGVVYLSYNVLDGWRDVLPLREFLVKEASRAELVGQPLAVRIEQALRAAQQYVASDPPELLDNPQFERHLRKIRHQRKAYLAHEYFNRDWAPMSFEDVAAQLSTIGLVYVAQAVDGVAEAARSPSFRRDLWVRDGAVAGGAFVDDSRSLAARSAATSILNDRLLQWAAKEPQLSVLASPRTGAGVDIGWRGLLALAAWRAGARTPAAIATQVAKQLQALGQPVVFDDTVISDDLEAQTVIEREARQFCEQTLPRLRELLIER